MQLYFELAVPISSGQLLELPLVVTVLKMFHSHSARKTCVCRRSLFSEMKIVCIQLSFGSSRCLTPHRRHTMQTARKTIQTTEMSMRQPKKKRWQKERSETEIDDTKNKLKCNLVFYEFCRKFLVEHSARTNECINF